VKKLAEVETAKALMKDAIDWSVLKWLWEKATVREIADKADAALDRLNRKTKAQWSEELKHAYRCALNGTNHKGNGQSQQDQANGDGADDPELLLAARRVRQIDDKARSARLDARQTFDQAERLLSTTLAREGCKKAIRSWDLHAKAILEAEALIRTVANEPLTTSGPGPTCRNR